MPKQATCILEHENYPQHVHHVFLRLYSLRENDVCPWILQSIVTLRLVAPHMLRSSENNTLFSIIEIDLGTCLDACDVVTSTSGETE